MRLIRSVPLREDTPLTAPPSSPTGLSDRVFIAARVTLLVGIVVALAWPYLSPAPPLARGVRAPDVHAQSYDGRSWDLSLFEGRPVFVNFFGSWCPPCVAEMPELVAAHEAKKDDVAFVGLAVDSPPDDVFALLRAHDVRYAIAATDPTTVRAWSATSLPVSFLISADRRVVWAAAGQVTKQDVVEQIDRHLAEVRTSDAPRDGAPSPR